MTLKENESQRRSGHCVRLVFLGAGTELCEEIEYYFGDESLAEATKHLWSFVESPEAYSLSTGRYRATVHPAFERATEFDDCGVLDWDSSILESITFRLERKVTVEECR